MSDLRVTDHAVLRYIERVQGLDVEAVRQHIARLCALPAAAGAMCVRAEGVKFEISKSGAVVSVVPGGGVASRLRRQRAGIVAVQSA